MSRVPDALLDTIFYLYPTAVDAEKGASAGGTGFIVFEPSKNIENFGFFYAVTASHVVREGGSRVIRFNRSKQPGFAIMEIEDRYWIHHPDADDVVIAPLDGPWMIQNVRFHTVHLAQFISSAIIKLFAIGIGDPVFWAGRFVARDGTYRNIPTYRSGQIAMMAHKGESANHPRGIRQEGFLIESWSSGGYSGSPVFVHLPEFLSRQFGEHFVRGVWLLGVDWGHIQALEPVRDRDGKPLDDGHMIPVNTGMMHVLPAWKIEELIKNDESLIEFRATCEAQRRKEIQQSS